MSAVIPFGGLAIVDEVAPRTCEIRSRPLLATIFSLATWSMRDATPNGEPSLYSAACLRLYHGPRVGEPSAMLSRYSWGTRILHRPTQTSAGSVDSILYFYINRIMELLPAIEALSALAHPGRLAAFRLLVRAGAEGVPAGEVARALDTPANTMSTQLAILTRAGLIRARRESRSIIYMADYPQITALLGFLMEDCCQGRPEICAPIAAMAACCPTPSEKSQ